VLCGHKIQNTVTEELQAFVISPRGAAIAHTGVGQGALEEIAICEDPADPHLERGDS
jgi:hypothetical protein